MPAEADPELAAKLARETQRIYSQAVAEMLERVATQVAAGIDTPTWAQAKLADVTRLRAASLRIIAALEGSASQEVAKALTQAHSSGAAAAEKELAGNFARSSGRALQELIRETLTNLVETHSAILRNTLDSYRNIIAETTARVSIGTQTRRQAAQIALDKFASAGIRGFTDSAGRKWEIETYSEMAVRTGSGRAAVAGALDRIESSGNDFVIVSNAPEECKICRPWEGKILSISGNGIGKQPGFTCVASVNDARSQGLLHSNCRHGLSAYIHGLVTAPTSTADPEGDKERQRHRELERRLRTAKRREIASAAYVQQIKKENGGRIDPATAQIHRRAVERRKAASTELTTFIDDTGRIRQRQREQVGKAR